jgi:hypothetical protein
MQRPGGMTSAEVTAFQPADGGGCSPGAPLARSCAAPRSVPPHDAAEAALRRRARRQGFWLTIASSAAMILLILATLLSFR